MKNNNEKGIKKMNVQTINIKQMALLKGGKDRIIIDDAEGI
jgi:hypothetical protein